MRLFRIQMSTKALSSIVPGGSAAGSALGYRLMTLSGVPGTDAGFALGTAGLGSAVVLNLIFWIGLMVSIPIRGVNPVYGSAAVVGHHRDGVRGGTRVRVDGRARAAPSGSCAGSPASFHFDDDRAATGVRPGRPSASRSSSTIAQLLGRVLVWAAPTGCSTRRRCGCSCARSARAIDIDALMVAFGLANVLAVIPITPGGLGIVDGGYIGMLVGFG